MYARAADVRDMTTVQNEVVTCKGDPSPGPEVAEEAAGVLPEQS